MRLQHVEFRVNLQIDTLDLLKKSVENLLKVGSTNLTLCRIETRFAALENLWEKFSINNEAIGNAMTQLSTKDKEKILNHKYFRSKIYQEAYELYLESSETMKKLLNDSQSQIEQSSSTISLSQISTPPTIFHRGPRLPRIDLPKFDGTPSEWLSFKDLFDSLVLGNPVLSSVEKLQYLKTSLTGSAASLLKNTALTAENFQKAWDALISFYENKRLLVNSALHSLLSIKRMTKESASEIEYLYTSITQIYRSLETLGRPVEAWDDFLVFIAVQRLDSESIKSWENHLGSSKDPPTWKQFNEFLMTRMLSLQAFERSTHGKTQFRPLQQTARVFHTDQSSIIKTCPFCSSNHSTSSCPQFVNKTVEQRIIFITKNRLCFNCLGRHRVSVCPSFKRCFKCGKKHHSLIHHTKNITPENPTSTSEQEIVQINHAGVNDKIKCPILLATAQVLVIAENGTSLQVRALIDPGSQISLITERVVQNLSLPRKHDHTILNGIGDIKAGKTKGTTIVTLSPHFKSSHKCSLVAHILPTLTSTIPALRSNQPNVWPHLEGLKLADPSFNIPGKIDVLIGSDFYGEIIEAGLRKGDNKKEPIAQQTIFGWVISGPQTLCQTFQNSTQGFHISVDKELHELLQKFWLLEEVPLPKMSDLTEENQQCEELFQKTHQRETNGRYIVRLPFKASIDNLGNSKNRAEKVLCSLNKRFAANKMYYQMYQDFLKEYENLNHMRRLPSSSIEPVHSFYLPHHGVMRESSLTTKLRVVFNGSSQSSSGISLNDILHTGAKLQTDLLDVLLWFRQYKFVFMTDIEKMYRQIKVHPDDWKFQRILWSDEKEKLITFELTTVTYGLACAPFLALRTIHQLVKDEGNEFPLAIAPLVQGRYVDDIFGGGDSIEETQQIVKQTKEICMAGGFPLQKWSSNHPEILKDISKDKHVNPPTLTIDAETTIHALGLCWNPTTDNFHFSMKISFPKKITKRGVLSTIAQIFDPLGFLTPVTIRSKLFMQELWAIKLDWDEELPISLSCKWSSYLQDLQELVHFSFPRWLQLNKDSNVQIHGFCDASQQAMAAVIYIRSESLENVNTTIICSKTKVAPLKRLTIPRLELSGAVILTKLVVHLIKVLRMETAKVYMWTDSSITYTWLNNHPSKWKEFVHNRVCYIQESLPHAQWRLIPGSENPADFSTRGMTAQKLRECPIWWNGPKWLKEPNSEWPNQPINISLKYNLEEMPSKIITAVVTEKESMWDLSERYSSFLILCRITATCQRVISRFRKVPDSSLTNPLTPGEIDQARKFWIKKVQEIYFQNEIQRLNKGEPLPKSHSLIKLTPFVDKYGFMRLGGRLNASSLPEFSKHPFILPRDSIITSLIIREAHIRTLHGGTQATLTYLRETCWIIGGRAPVRSYILKCITCTRYRKKRAEQLMGQLPSVRVNPSRPFLHSGVDYAGPISLKTWRGRSSRTYKAYIALFVCHSTSAIHIELVTDYTSEAFIAAYKRFIARRGICATLSSDCGTNLKGADSELRSLFLSASNTSKQIAILLANDGTKWIFNPPAAPHFGGKWEAGVKSVKYHLRRIIGDKILTYEEMNTLLTQIEAVLNSRPLHPITDDPEDLTALTPGHFLIGSSPNLLPEPSLETEKITRLSRWQHLRQMLDSFWIRWSKECLQRYQAIYKWNKINPSLKKGTLVLVMDERYPPSKWPLGRITELHPGKDELIRVVTVKTQCSVLKRPIVKICPLPIEVNES